MRKKILYSTVMIVSLALISSFFVIAQTDIPPLSQQGKQGDEILILDVSGTDCPTCPSTLDKALESIPGVKNVQIGSEKNEVIVTVDPQKVSEQQLIDTASKAGYAARIISIKN